MLGRGELDVSLYHTFRFGCQPLQSTASAGRGPRQYGLLCAFLLVRLIDYPDEDGHSWAGLGRATTPHAASPSCAGEKKNHVADRVIYSTVAVETRLARRARGEWERERAGRRGYHS